MKLGMVAFGLILIGASVVLAGEPASRASRKRIEATLAKPAQLDFSARTRVTIREVLDQLRNQHQLSVRIDAPTVATMLESSRPAAPSMAFSIKPSPYSVPVAFQAYAAPPGTAAPVVERLPSGDLPKPTQAEPYRPDPLPPTAEAPANVGKIGAAEPAQSQDDDPLTVEKLLETELDLRLIDQSQVTVATLLRQALDAAPTVNPGDSEGLPLLLTNGALLDYLVENDGIVITSRMKALATKEARVYSIKHLNGVPADELARTIRQSIRPWSWRSQINDLGDQLKGTPMPAEALTSILNTGVQLVGAETGITVATASDNQEVATSPNLVDQARQLEMLGGVVANGLVTMAQTTLLALEMVHYAEAPTGTIQVLGSKLVITQSQAAHREIADLLEALGEE